jgi:hypothetical protein
MGAYNALDDLLPGSAWDPGPAWDPDAADPAGEPAPSPRRPRLEPVPDQGRPSRRRRGRRRGANALDDLLPGPGDPGVDDLLPGPSAPSGRRRQRAWNRPSAGGRTGRHLGVWNPLDGPPPATAAPAPAKARVGFRLPADLVETARDAVAHLAETGDRTTLTALAERALRVELARLTITHNDGQPFPPRDA